MSVSARSAPDPTPALLVALIPAGVLLVAIGVPILVSNTDYDVWGAALVCPLLLLACWPLARYAARLDGDQRMIGFVMAAAFTKIVLGTGLRYFMIYGLYDGTGDSDPYHKAGSLLAPAFRHGDFSGIGEISGTRFIDVVTGSVYAVTGSTRLGGFVVFSFFGFLGLYLCYLAFREGFPTGDRRRYRWLVFFFPTMLFWPSAIGKEAWMLLMLGLFAYGSALLLKNRLHGLVPLGLGLWGTIVVRPHIAVIMVVALGVAFVIRRRPAGIDGLSARSGAGIVILGAIVVFSAVAVNQFESFFDVEDLSLDSAHTVLEEANDRSAQGGSAFTPSNAETPQGFATATVTVILRPLPGEVGGAEGAVSSLESLVMIGLILLSIDRLLRLPRAVTRTPYVAMALVFTAGFVFAFSTIGNFGLLARQRVQLLPFFFVLLSVAKREVDQADEPSERVATVE